MKHLACFAIFCMVIVSCTPPEDPQIAIDEANTKVVFDYINAATTGDIDAMSAALTDGFWSYGPAIADSSSKADNIAGWAANWDSVFTKINYERVATTTKSFAEGPLAGDWVSDWATITVDYQNGSQATFRFNGVYRVEDGKITRSTSFYDRADLLTQIGWELNPPSTEEEGDEDAMEE